MIVARRALALLAALACPPTAQGQSLDSLTIEQAVRLSLTQHPAVASARAAVAGATADLRRSQLARWPTIEAQAQGTRATGNVLAGTQFPAMGLATVSGPPRDNSPAGGAWAGTTALVASVPLVGTWRAGRVQQSRLAERDAAQARLLMDQLDVAAGTAAAFLALRVARAQQDVASAGLQRARTLDSVTTALAAQGLRPGVDSMRAAAEVALAETDVARAQQAIAIGEARLVAAMGLDAGLPADVRGVRDDGASTGRVQDAVGGHALEREAMARTQAASAARAAVALDWLPRIELAAALWARGSGEATSLLASDGRAPQSFPVVRNWALGVVLSWSASSIPMARAQREREDANVRMAQERTRAVQLAIAADRGSADAARRGADIVLERSRAAVTAADAAVEQTLARFRAGLTSVTDVADAQRQLARAEGAAAVAAIERQSAQLEVARATGRLDQFLDALRTASAPGSNR